MIADWIKLLIIELWFSNPQKPVNDLHPKREPKLLGQLNWTFILLLAFLIGFFVFIWVFQLGNEYPNELMNNI